ncbi:MerR family transcriptional regulator [Sporosarcina sp. Te-1]|uniref:MerR family transcriptional regulator n=1 Tax=Sporosarcina sp. Te-1 TaxID=2818390 RepID=UPI001A9DBAC6|nr:MerR family transcriptional regulator [Sporosarcina sp. Te-1]QTD40882.1 MerR family transcriptional regulator [Sporosarcina sp. Te-1]
MKKYYSIGETASLAKMTIETIRHYDRIGLLKPARVDKQSGYRYYTDEELICMMNYMES